MTHLKSINSISKVLHNYALLDGGLVMVRGDLANSHLEIQNKQFDKIFSSENLDVYDFFIAKNSVVFTNNKAEATYALDASDMTIKVLPYTLHIKGKSFDNTYLCYATYNGKDYYIEIALDSLNILNCYSLNIGLKGVKIHLGDIFVSTNKNLIALFSYSNDACIWQYDVQKVAAYSDYDGYHSGIIKLVYTYENQIIASVTRGIISFDFRTGKIIWHVKVENFNPSILHIVNDKVYLSQGIYYTVIDLKTGEKILDTTLGKNIVVNDITIPMVSSRPDIVHYNNKIWHLDRHEGKYYLFARVPDTGEITYSKYLCELTAPCHAPQFHEEMMYVLDQQGTLHIFEVA